jgi:hypothetical protein
MRLSLLLLVLLAGALAAIAGPPGGVSAEAIRRHVLVLGADELEGRATGSRGGEKAARYIAAELKRFGVRPLGERGDYDQPVPMHAARPGQGNELFLVSECGTGPLLPGEDYLLDAASEGTLIPQLTELVFAAHGIVAPEYDHDDYQGLDVAGKVVAVLDGEPPSRDPRYFDAERPTVYSTPEAKRRLALSRGARGLLLLPSGQDVRWKDWEYWRRQEAPEQLSLEYAVPSPLTVRLHPRVAVRLLCGSGLDLAGVHQLEAGQRLYGFALSARLRYRGSFLGRDFVAPNVAGLVQGSDPELRDSYVLVSAHYDHLGIGPPEGGDRIYNGVVDNAIGVAGALEIARAIAARPVPPRRSVAFLFTTGEEKGLLGATHYANHPLVPLSRTVANVNVDGLAHLDSFSDVIGVGSELSSLGSVLERVAARQGLRVSPPPAILAASEAFAFSDQAAFAEAGVPAILVNEGFEGGSVPSEAALARFLEWGRTRYHRPSDDLSQPLDFEASRRHAGLILELVLELAESPDVPAWKRGVRHAAAQARARAERR